MSTESGKTENQQEATISSLALQMDSLFHLEDYLSVVDKATDIFQLIHKMFQVAQRHSSVGTFSGLISRSGSVTAGDI